MEGIVSPLRTSLIRITSTPHSRLTAGDGSVPWAGCVANFHSPERKEANHHPEP
jgi:hypothetical protein